MKNIISIIVPVYNAEKTLKKCIESVLKQTEKNFELVLVDDGSTDESNDICNMYNTKFKNIIFIKKKNGGAASARNYAIENANGTYILFLDSDDELKKDCIENINKIIKQYNADIVKFGVEKKSKFIAKKNNTINSINNRFIKKENYDEIYTKMLETYYFRNVIGVTFKKEIINNVKFNEKLLMAEDSLFFFEALNKSRSIFISDKVIYTYRYNTSSVTHRFDKDNLIKKLDDVIYVNKIVFDYYKDKNIIIPNEIDFKELKITLENSLKHGKYSDYINIKKKICNDENLKEVIEKNKNNKIFYYTKFDYICFKLKEKVKMLILKFV